MCIHFFFLSFFIYPLTGDHKNKNNKEPVHLLNVKLQAAVGVFDLRVASGAAGGVTPSLGGGVI